MSHGAGGSLIHSCVFTGLVAAAALLGGCAGSPEAGESMSMENAASSAPDSGPIIGDVSPPRERARVHTELAGLYYERSNMGVALEELRIALGCGIPTTRPHTMFLGLVHMDLREYSQAQQSFERGLRITPTIPTSITTTAGSYARRIARKLRWRYFLAAIKNPLYPTPQKFVRPWPGCGASRKGLDRDARDYFERALRIDRTLPWP